MILKYLFDSLHLTLGGGHGQPVARRGPDPGDSAHHGAGHGRVPGHPQPRPRVQHRHLQG